MCWSSTANRPFALARVPYLSEVGTAVRSVTNPVFHDDIVLGNYMQNSVRFLRGQRANAAGTSWLSGTPARAMFLCEDSDLDSSSRAVSSATSSGAG